MNWQQQASRSPTVTALAVRDELAAGRVESAALGLEELIDALTRSDRRALKGQLIRLMAHVIKWNAQPDRRSRSWVASIHGAREEIRDIQEDAPSLTDEVVRGMWDKCLALAREQAEAEMNQESQIESLAWDEVFVAEYLL